MCHVLGGKHLCYIFSRTVMKLAMWPWQYVFCHNVVHTICMKATCMCSESGYMQEKVYNSEQLMISNSTAYH